MSGFFSGIMTRQGDLLWHPATDAHEDLVQHFKFRDDSTHRMFVRLEYKPSGRLCDLNSYSVRLTDPDSPDWFDEEAMAKADNRMRSIVNSMIVHNEERDILLGETCILSGASKIKIAKNVRIIAMYDSSSVGCLRGSSFIDSMCNLSSVRKMQNESSIHSMYNCSAVIRMGGSSQIVEMHDSSSVHTMYRSSRAPRKPRLDNRG